MIKSMTAYASFMSKEAGFGSSIKNYFSSNPTEGQTGATKGLGEGKSETLTRMEASPGGLAGAKTSGMNYKKDYQDITGTPEATEAFNSRDENKISNVMSSGFGKKIEGAGMGAVSKAKQTYQGSQLYDTQGKGGLSEWEQMNPSQQLAPMDTRIPSNSVLPDSANKWLDKTVRGATDKGVRRMTAEQTASSPEMKNVVETTQKEYDKRIGDAVGKWGPWVAGLGLGGLGLYLALNQQGQAIQGDNMAQAPTGSSDWANEGKWQSGMQQGEEPQAPVADV